MNCALLKDWRWGEAITAHTALWAARKFHHLTLGSVGATYGHCMFFDTLPPFRQSPDRMDMTALARCSAGCPVFFQPTMLITPETWNTMIDQRDALEERAEKAEARVRSLTDGNSILKLRFKDAEIRLKEFEPALELACKVRDDDIRLLRQRVKELEAANAKGAAQINAQINRIYDLEARVKALEGLCARLAAQPHNLAMFEPYALIREVEAAGRGEPINNNERTE